jgi:hypothetical protein
MKGKTDVIFAGILGTAAVFGIFAIRNFLRNKDYHKDYSDYHRLFGKSASKQYSDFDEGIEINAFL